LVEFKNLSISFDTFPKDNVLRQIISLDGIESVPTRSNERRWRVTLQELQPRNNTGNKKLRSEHTVSSEYLWVLGLGSLWRGNKREGDNNLPDAQIVHLDDPNPLSLWRDLKAVGTPHFLDKEVAGNNRTSIMPNYQLIRAIDNHGSLWLCISYGELMRFFIGRSPTLSRHVFEFREKLENPALYRHSGLDFLNGTPTKIEIVDRDLGEQGRKLLISLLIDKVGKLQLLSAARSARAAISKNRNSNGSLGKVYPVFGLPYQAKSDLEVIGAPRTICIEVGDEFQMIDVLAVTRIVDTGHQPPPHNMSIVTGVSPSKGRDIPIPKPSVRKRLPEDIPHDVPDKSDSDAEILVKMGVDIEDSYSGLDEISIENEVVSSANPAIPFFEFNNDDPTELTGLSTHLGGGVGGTIGHSRGTDGDSPPAIQKSLLLTDDDLPDLLKCKPNIILGQSDVIFKKYSDVPDRLKLLAACIAKTRSGLGPDWSKYFLGSNENSLNIPLISLRRLPGQLPIAETGEERRAIVGILENDQYRVVFLDIEKSGTESIGIMTLLVPIDKNVGWEELSYIIAHRLSPSVKGGTWPNAKTHGGGYVAKVQSHNSFYDDEQTLGKITHKFVDKLASQFVHVA